MKMTDQMKVPLLYPCAHRVQMPHVGADKTNLKPVNKNKNETFDKNNQLKYEVNKNYLKRISTDFMFTEDVVRERCFHMLPYDRKYFKEALDISDIVTPPQRTNEVMGRHNNRASDKTHLPCHIKKRTTHQLKPIKRKILEYAIQNQQAELSKEEDQKELDSLDYNVEKMPDIFLTETNQDVYPDHTKSSQNEIPNSADIIIREYPNWDETMFSAISSTTARWIAAHQISPGPQRDKLLAFLNDYYGPPPEDDKADLIRDNISEGDVTERLDVQTNRKWRRADETLLSKVKELSKQLDKPTDPYDDDNAAAFYRLPAGFKRAQKKQAKEDAGAINTTAHNILVKPFEPLPPPTLRDYMNPSLGKYVYDTDNMFQQERLTGAQQVYNRLEDPHKITTELDNKYRKQYQKISPGEPKTWFPLTDKEKKKNRDESGKIKKLNKGLCRWNELPKLIDDTAENLNLALPSTNAFTSVSPNAESRKQVRNNATLIQIVNDWRSKWHLDMRYADATPEDLIKDMADIHPHIRLKAITTCARAAEYRPPPEPGIQLDNIDKPVSQVKLLPDKLFIALGCCLDDEHEQVSRAAAIALYTLEHPTEKAEQIMRTTLKNAKSIERWTAAQCLAYFGECDSEVVGELVAQLLNTEDSIRYERAATLLAKLSHSSTLVHSMLAEQLNSSSWRHRVIVCKVMPKLHGEISKDLVHKLSYLMWNDWHNEVRKAAAHTLGKVGHGKDVHDELRDKILNGNERVRLDAVSKVGHLGIMTAKLLPAFLECFTDSYVSIRMEACIACNLLKIKDKQVLEKLVFLATYDSIWRVKALAFQAMGVIGEITDSIRECILWALRYEEQPGVRAEACHSVVKMGLKDQEVGQILQDRLLVETSNVVKKEITKALEMFGISPTEDMDMVSQIKNEVRKLCTRNQICNQITINENATKNHDDIERMIANPFPSKPLAEKKKPRMYRRPLSKQDQIQSFEAKSPDEKSIRSRELIPSRGSTLTQAADSEIKGIFDRQDTSLTNEEEYETATNYSQKTETEFSKANSTEKLNTLDITDEQDSVLQSSRSYSKAESGFPQSNPSMIEDSQDEAVGMDKIIEFGDSQHYVEITDEGYEQTQDKNYEVLHMNYSSGNSSEDSDSSEDDDVQQDKDLIEREFLPLENFKNSKSTDDLNFETVKDSVIGDQST